MICDSHCHLQDKRFRGEIEKLIQEAKKVGVEKIIIPGWDLLSSKEAVELAWKFENVYAACGVHPHDAKFYDDVVEEEIRKLVKNKKVVAIGEIGLDYYRNISPKEIQIDVFKRQLKIAEENNLPVIIHTRDSIEDVIKIVKEFSCKGVFHAFNGSEDVAERVIEMSFYLGVGGVITYPNAKIAKVLKEISLDNVLVETDAPYLTPHPKRGKRNEPAYTIYVVKKITEIKNKSFEEVSNRIYDNTVNLFGINNSTKGGSNGKD
ncbi:MAG: TatD family hydrolase [candidate division WOR-3 bacterium]